MQQLFLLLPQREALCQHIPSLAEHPVVEAALALPAWAKLLDAPLVSKSVLIAISRGQIKEGEIALLCEFVCLQEDGLQLATSISLEDSQRLLDAWASRLEVSYRAVADASGHHLVILPAAPFTAETRLVPADDLTPDLSDSYPRGPGSEVLHHWLNLSMEVCAESQTPDVTTLWFSDIGHFPRLDRNQFKRTNTAGRFFTQHEWQRGLAKWLGWQATDYQDLAQLTKTLNASEAADNLAVQIPPPSSGYDNDLWCQTVAAFLTDTLEQFAGEAHIGWYKNQDYSW